MSNIFNTIFENCYLLIKQKAYISTQQWNELQNAIELFKKELNVDPVIVFENLGYLSGDAGDSEETKDGCLIRINTWCSFHQQLSTLAHEMMHNYCYINKIEWDYHKDDDNMSREEMTAWYYNIRNHFEAEAKVEDMARDLLAKFYPDIDFGEKSYREDYWETFEYDRYQEIKEWNEYCANNKEE